MGKGLKAKLQSLRGEAHVRQNRMRSIWNRLALAAIAFVAAFMLVAYFANAPASAQSWWPFGGGEEPRRAPVPREPVYRQPPPAPIPDQQGAPAAQTYAGKNPICLQLEQRLVVESQKGTSSREQLTKVEREIAQIDREFNVNASQLDRGCYEYFLFTKSFRNTPKCKDLARQVEVSKRRLSDLEAQRQGLASGRSYQDDIVRELARNGCGANYADQARRRDGEGLWSEEGEIGSSGWTPQGITAGETYRTVCVRLCDGYYFPVSFSTLPSHFSQDAQSCTSKCAAPVELYYHPNPGGTMEQAVALQSNEPYTNLKTAFRYRKEYVNGCSCKQAEYLPPATAGRKAEGGAETSVTTGSTGSAASGWEAQAVPNADVP